MLQNGFDYYPVLFIPGFAILILLAVSVTLSAIGGWMSLGKKFRHQGEFRGEYWVFQDGKMRFIAGYRGCLKVGSNDNGLYLSTVLPFRIAHPPLFIPWSEVNVEWTKTASSWPGVKLILGRELRVPLWINEKLAINIKRAAGASWPDVS